LENVAAQTAKNFGARSMSQSTTDGRMNLLVETVQHSLRDVAKAIAENNKRIAEQLEKAGIKIT
jgi:hypothetical protein